MKRTQQQGPTRRHKQPNYVYTLIQACEIISDIAPGFRVAKLGLKVLRHRRNMRALADLSNIIKKGWPS